MKSEPLHKIFHIPMSEWLSSIPNELEDDAVGLWQIIPVGRSDFGLEGEALIKYVREALLKLLLKGARPVEGAVDGVHYWRLRNDYGNDPEKIADAVIVEWISSGRDPDPSGIWFALPKVFNLKH